jgi:glycosyltransferase involved in cell wall biosynthesis
MKIALLTEKYTPDIGGLAISSERLAGLLASAGHEVRVFAPSLSLPPSEKRTLPSGRDSLTRFGASKRVDDTLADWFELIVAEHTLDPFDVLHAYFLTQAGFVAAYAGKYLGIPSVVSMRGNDIERAAFDPSRFSHVMYALQNANAVTTNAGELARKARALIDREIHIIPNGIDTDRFKPMKRNEALVQNVILPKDHRDDMSEAKDLKHSRRDSSWRQSATQSDIPIIGFVGELRKKKGLETLLSAHAQISSQRPIVLLVVGEVRQGDDGSLLEEFQSANPKSPIVITGHIPHNDLPAYYSLMDVFVHPSLRDGMPNAVLEAMACEKAVIATAVGGIKDILEDGKTGVVVNVNDVNMLAQKITELLDHPEKRALLGKNARELIADRYTSDKELKANLDVYRKLT